MGLVNTQHCVPWGSMNVNNKKKVKPSKLSGRRPANTSFVFNWGRRSGGAGGWWKGSERGGAAGERGAADWGLAGGGVRGQGGRGMGGGGLSEWRHCHKACVANPKLIRCGAGGWGRGPIEVAPRRTAERRT